MSANVTFTYSIINRWLVFRLALGIVVLCTVASFFCLAFKGIIDGELLSFSLQILTDMAVYFAISMLCLTEMQMLMTSAQSIHRYTQLDQEDDLVKPRDAELIAEIKDHLDANRSSPVLQRKLWPMQGRIEFKDVTMKYRENLPPSIENLSFTI